MYGKKAHSSYQSVQVTTVDRGRLLLMMYEGAIKFLRQANVGLETKDIPKFCRYLSKSQAIIAELMNTLDYEKGGQIAKDLYRLYDFMMFYLTEANLYRDPVRIEKVIELINTIYSAYKEIIEQEEAKRYQDNTDSTVLNVTQAKKESEANVNRRIQISL
jgi:flagellar secretion chaperone FliS